jgi:hypothetical protein
MAFPEPGGQLQWCPLNLEEVPGKRLGGEGHEDIDSTQGSEKQVRCHGAAMLSYAWILK